MATTAEVVEFIDKLFDSVNGNPGGSKAGKLRRAVKEDSPHHTFWVDAIKKLKSLYYIDTSSKHALQLGKPRLVKVPSLQGWITTLESFLKISKLLFNKYGVMYFYPRRINQDPLENFFGRLRALNSRNVNPDANAFIYAFKSLLITNLLSPHSKYANCEEDEGNSIVNIKCLFENENKENMEDNKEIPSSSQEEKHLFSVQECPNENILVDQVILEKVRVHCSAYTAGLQVHNWCNVINKILKGAVEEKYISKMGEPQKQALNKYKSFRLRKKCLNK
ncbi:hypothetical protein HF086_011249 [Spodoptera exigua]|uniref:Transposable element P transposase-like RNase H C-terminal domain-containing protein n=1 Tax=Spodoptera exigua TaxID=7107 RepID=A0A922SFG6_SPOEX|nr:hypothetical protein HF086_011249 [Spodoptera exigua]